MTPTETDHLQLWESNNFSTCCGSGGNVVALLRVTFHKDYKFQKLCITTPTSRKRLSLSRNDIATHTSFQKKKQVSNLADVMQEQTSGKIERHKKTHRTWKLPHRKVIKGEILFVLDTHAFGNWRQGLELCATCRENDSSMSS